MAFANNLIVGIDIDYLTAAANISLDERIFKLGPVRGSRKSYTLAIYKLKVARHLHQLVFRVALEVG